MKIINSLTAFPAGLAYIVTKPFVWKYLFLAIVLNIFSVFFAILFVALAVNSGGNRLLELLQADISQLGSLFIGLSALFIALVIVYLLFGFISSTVNAPVYASLAETIAKDEYKIAYPKRSLITEIKQSFAFEIKKAVIVVLILLISLPLNLIPRVGQVLFTLFNVLQLIIITGLDLFEPILSVERPRFRSKLRRLLTSPGEYWAFLLIAGTVCSIPIVNIFTIPAAIVGAIKLELNLKK